jgi:uncharacterized membrane protein YkvA (DUF1232 family)
VSWSSTWSLLGTAGASLLLIWVVLVGVLWLRRPGDTDRLREALRLLPDIARLVRRLAADASLPRGVRVRLWLLVGYLASPLDLVPDVLPVIGWADDVVVVALVLRAVVRAAGDDALARHWPGTAEGLRVVRRLAGIDPEDTRE